MGPEEGKTPGIPNDLEELERLFAQREEKLPNSVAKHVRDLKAQGRWEEAMRIAQQEKERKEQTRQQKAEAELNRSIYTIIKTSDPLVQKEHEVKAIWLLEAAGLILSEEKTQGIIQILDSTAPELKTALEGRLAKIRDEMEPLLPEGKRPLAPGKYHHPKGKDH